MNRRTLIASGLLLPLAAAGALGGAAQAQRPVRLLLVLVGGGPRDIETTWRPSSRRIG